MIAVFCIGEETQKSFFVSLLSHSLRFTGVQGRFLASLEMTMREGGILPPSPGRRCPEGAEVGSRSGVKGDVWEAVFSFH